MNYTSSAIPNRTSESYFKSTPSYAKCCCFSKNKIKVKLTLFSWWHCWVSWGDTQGEIRRDSCIFSVSANEWSRNQHIGIYYFIAVLAEATIKTSQWQHLRRTISWPNVYFELLVLYIATSLVLFCLFLDVTAHPIAILLLYSESKPQLFQLIWRHLFTLIPIRETALVIISLSSERGEAKLNTFHTRYFIWRNYTEMQNKKSLGLVILRMPNLVFTHASGYTKHRTNMVLSFRIGENKC